MNVYFCYLAFIDMLYTYLIILIFLIFYSYFQEFDIYSCLFSIGTPKEKPTN